MGYPAAGMRNYLDPPWLEPTATTEILHRLIESLKEWFDLDGIGQCARRGWISRSWRIPERASHG